MPKSSFLLSSARLLCLAAFLLPAFAAPLRAVTLSPQEQAIANDMISNPGQGRSQLILDPIIENLARARAKDMADRDYFAHVNPDGNAANYLLRQAGYVLPSWWSTERDLNFVESIAAGYADAASTWNAWMNSPEHKEHLLALKDFFKSETHYGVGFYQKPGSTYVYYWVVITAPPQPAQAVEITTPSGDGTSKSNSAAIAGTTTSASAPALVQYRLENSGGTGGWQTATGLANWSGEVTGLLPGPNVVRVQSLDASSSAIYETTCEIDYVVPANLTVAVNGNGAVSSGFLGTTSRNEGASVTIKATAARGYVFQGWTGSLTSGSASLTFTMEPGMNLQANFEITPFPAVAGSYDGLLTASSNVPNGSFRATVSGGGVLTGRVVVNGTSYAFTGRLDASGAATVRIPRHGLSPLTLTFQLDLSGGTQQLTGALSDGAETSSISADHATFNAKKNPSRQAGRYTMILSPAAKGDGSQTPQGNGYAILSVKASGAAILSGRMGDGTPFSHGGTVTENGSLPISFVPHGETKGSGVNGLLTFRSTDLSDLDGTLSWVKAARQKDAYYPAGFATQLPSVGARYAAPHTGSGIKALAVSDGSATAALGDADLPQVLNVPVQLGANDVGTMVTPGAPDLSFRINPASGTVTGKFTLPNGHVVRGMGGVVLQKQNAAFGYFRGSDQSGYFALSPAS